MRSPKEMRLAQIDITNACVHACSNCTRLCGNHKKNFYMDWETFKKAVDSMEGFEGSVGIIGGEPFLHPDFERFARYLGEKNAVKQEPTTFVKPAKDYMRRMASEELPKYECYETKAGVRDRLAGPSIFTTVTEGFYKHFEMLHDTFRFMGINDHTLPSFHQPILVARKDLGIPDDEWIKMRDSCWVQNTWCTSITPKGAFFCEVAASLDMLFDGPGGWPIEKGWWKREPEEFGDQLQWCEICGLAIDSFSRDANEEIDDISPTLYERLKKMKSPRVIKDKVNIISCNLEEFKKSKGVAELKKNSFSDDYKNRLINCRKYILPHGIDGAIIYRGGLEKREFYNKLKKKAEFVDLLYVIDVTNSIEEEKINDSKIKVIPNWHISGEYTLGCAINALRNVVNPDHFILLTDENMDAINENILSWKEYVCNPGVVIYNENILFFNLRASALISCGYPEMKKIKSIKEFISLYDVHKTLKYDDTTFSDDVEEFIPGKEYIIYAAGGGGQKVLRHLKEVGCKVKFFGDSNPEKWGKTIDGVEIVSPQTVKEKQNGAPIIIATVLHGAIIKSLVDIGIDRNTIILSGWAL